MKHLEYIFQTSTHIHYSIQIYEKNMSVRFEHGVQTQNVL
jgi:hypothetical protein